EGMWNARRCRAKDPSSALASGQAIGQVVAVRGSKASVGRVAPLQRDGVRATVGKFLGISAGRTLLVGVITNVLVSEGAGATAERAWHSTADVDFVGEIKQSAASPQFQRGVSAYPA